MNPKFLRNRIALRAFPEYSHITEEKLSKDFKSLVPDNKGLELDDIQRVIFAPDPKTGIPRSDLGIILSKDSRPEVADYIQRSLMGFLPSSPSTDSADDALVGVKSRYDRASSSHGHLQV